MLKRILFEIYLFSRFVFYGVDDPREEEMIERYAQIRRDKSEN